MRFSLLLLLGILLTSFTIDKEPAYQTAPAKNGDGVYSLLRRYQLLNSSDNINKFYAINGLGANANLVRGKTYKLPVLLYTYDGVSIRSSIGMDDIEIAKRIEAYNLSILNLGIVERHYSESKTLWVPMHTINKAPEVKKNVAKPVNNTARIIEEPLFGSKYAKTEVSSEILKGKVFYLISGHGGPDPGAMSEVSGSTICEDEYSYDVSLRLAKRLMEHGATVEIIVQDLDDGIRDDQILHCDKDEKSLGKTTIPIRQVLRLQQRTHEVNSLYQQYRKQGYKDHSVEMEMQVDERTSK